MRRIVVVAIRHPEHENLFLHLLRSDNSKWAAPGGHMEPGETPLEGARRELKEETGIDLDQLEALRNGEYPSEIDGKIQVHLFGGVLPPDAKITGEDDPDQEAVTFKFLDPTTQRNMHVPRSRNIMVEHLEDMAKAELEKMSRPLVGFPKMGIAPEPHNVQPVATPRQKKIMGRKVLNEMFPKQQIADQDRGKLAERAMGGKGAKVTAGGNFIPSRPELQRNPGKSLPYVNQGKYTPGWGRGTPTNKLPTNDMKIERGRAQDATIAHEAHHTVFHKLAQKIGEEGKNKVLDRLMQHAFPDVAHRNEIFNYVKRVGYDPKKSTFSEEMVNAVRDSITSEAGRNQFRNYMKEKYGEDRGYEKANYMIQAMKQGWNKFTSAAKAVDEHFHKADSQPNVGAKMVNNDMSGGWGIRQKDAEDFSRGAQKSGAISLDQAWSNLKGAFGKEELDKGANGDWKKEGYTFSYDPAQSKTGPYSMHQVTAHDRKGQPVGTLTARNHGPGHFEADLVNVHSDHQRKGLATAMYQHMQLKTGRKPKPSADQTPDGKKLWRGLRSQLHKAMDSRYQNDANAGFTVLVPAHIEGQGELAPGIPHHTTVKMFRHPEKPLDSKFMEDMTNELKGQKLPTPDASKLSFEPTTFTSPRTGQEYHQLKVHGFPDEFKQMYEKYRGHGLTFPEYTPHITINKELHDKIVSGEIPIDKLNVKFGAPELRNGQKILHTFEAPEPKKT